VDNAGAPECQCDDGYHPQGLDCVADADSCQGVTCSGHGTCVDNAGTPECQCDAGYHAVGLDCQADGQQNFVLEVPQGCQVCSIMGRRVDIIETYLHKTRLELQAGVFLLPRQMDGFELDLVGLAEVRPEREVATAQQAGTVVVTLTGTPDNGVYWYSFSQLFATATEPFEVVFMMSFEVANGVAAQPRIVMDEDTFWLMAMNALAWQPPSGGGYGQLKGVFGDGGSGYTAAIQYLSTCDHTDYELGRFIIQMAGGDTLQLDMYFRDPPDAMIPSCAAALLDAQFSKGGEQRQVSDHFRLAVSLGHHSFYQDYLVVFDQPVQSVHAVHFYAANPYNVSHPDHVVEVNYLDSGFNTLTSETISSFEFQGRQCSTCWDCGG
jgi:hypothetical protein